MFDEAAFRYALARKGKSLSEAAKAMGISLPTLYRKMSGESDFYCKEIQKCREFLEEDDLNNIFFA